MSWKERRLVTILTGILLALAAALLIVLGMRYRENRDQADNPPEEPQVGIVTEQDAFSSLTYENGSATLAFVRTESGSWSWDVDRSFPLDDTVLREILDLLVNWNPQQTLTDAKALEGSGLSEPSGSLVVTTEDGTAQTLLFGKKTTDGKSIYVRRNGDEKTVYILDGKLFQLMQTPIYDMCALPELPQPREEQLQSISLLGPAPKDGETGLETLLTAQKAEGEEAVSWRYNGANVTDDPLVRSLMEDVTALAFEKCVDFKPSAKAVEVCGLNAPDAVLSIVYQGEKEEPQTLTIQVGGRLADGSGRFARLEGESTIYLLKTDLLDPLMRIAGGGLEG